MNIPDVSIVPGPEDLRRQLLELGLEGLRQMFNQERGLFYVRLRRTANGTVTEGISRRDTLIALIGLAKAEAVGFRSPVETIGVLDRLQRDDGIQNGGVLGLFLWACSLASVQCLRSKWSTLASDRVLNRYRDLRECRTMELAWFLTGLSQAALACPALAEEIRPLANKTFRLIEKNQEESGLFRHGAGNKSIAGMLRSRLATFADQVYPIYALSRFFQCYGVPAALSGALACAEAIRRLQGPMGQWWWHYDAPGGRVVSRYPVYSVHQDGMAPMALFALTEAADVSFADSIDRGLRWIYGANELGLDLRDEACSVIWRNIHLGKRARYFEEAASLLGLHRFIPSLQSAEVLFECHSYHLGWLLYANALGMQS